MDGSRGATGAVDVGVSHLNMNINVVGGGHGLGSGGLASGGDKGTAGGDSSSSSPPVGGEFSRRASTAVPAAAPRALCGTAFVPRVLSHLPHQKEAHTPCLVVCLASLSSLHPISNGHSISFAHIKHTTCKKQDERLTPAMRGCLAGALRLVDEHA